LPGAADAGDSCRQLFGVDGRAGGARGQGPNAQWLLTRAIRWVVDQRSVFQSRLFGVGGVRLRSDVSCSWITRDFGLSPRVVHGWLMGWRWWTRIRSRLFGVGGVGLRPCEIRGRQHQRPWSRPLEPLNRGDPMGGDWQIVQLVSSSELVRFDLGWTCTTHRSPEASASACRMVPTSGAMGGDWRISHCKVSSSELVGSGLGRARCEEASHQRFRSRPIEPFVSSCTA
jgi:hypothetical protein